MSTLKTLQGLSSAEDFFRVLDVPYDPRVLDVCRLHILRRMGHYMRAEDLAGGTDEIILRRCKAFLERAYQDFVESTPLQERVFKVLQDAVKPKAPYRPALVSLSGVS
jgi:nitrogenase-stabilizing/protective protein